MRFHILQVTVDTKRLASYALIAFILGGALGGVLFNFGGIYVSTTGVSDMFGYMQRFQSVHELKEYLTERDSVNIYWMEPSGLRGLGFSSLETEESMTMDGEVLAGSANEYSGTNVQVEGVDEADIVKTDGTYIYFAKGSEVVFVKAYPVSEAEIVSRINLTHPVQDIYVSDNRLIVFTSETPDDNYYIFDETTPYTLKSILTIFDITEKENPDQIREIKMDGTYFNSRLIDNYLYFIIRNPAYTDDDTVPLPTIREDKTWSTIEADCIWYPNHTRGWMAYHTIISIDVQAEKGQLTTETFLLDEGSTIYVSPTNLYLTSEGWWRETQITKIEIQNGDIKFKANGTVPGYVLNQYSMDEKNEYFRIATTGSSDGRREGNNVYVMNSELETVGSVEGLAKGEQIYSTRFMGDRCYLVTFKITDPLFTIDLSNPENPKVLGALKIPGYSTYLHPYNENILIGIGKETIEDKGGEIAWQQGVKISLFDVSNVTDPKELAKLEVGDRGTESRALYDPHAFLFSRSKNLLVIPILETQIDESDYANNSVPINWHGEYVNQGAYVFQISETGITQRGSISHIDDPEIYLMSSYWFESDLEVQRSLYIEDNLYTLSNDMIKVNNILDLKELAVIDLGD